MTVQLSSKFDVYAIPLGGAEKSFTVSEAMKIQLSCRDGSDAPTSFRLASVQGGTSNGQYLAMSAGVIVFEGDLRLTQTMYFASQANDATMELMIWK